MKHMRFTNAHQSLAFSRRMMLLGAAQGVIGHEGNADAQGV